MKTEELIILITIIVLFIYFLFVISYYKKNIKNLLVGSFGKKEKIDAQKEYLDPIKKMLWITFGFASLGAVSSFLFVLLILTKLYQGTTDENGMLQLLELISSGALTFAVYQIFGKILNKYTELTKVII